MSEITRKLASIRRIGAVEPIPGADRIVLAHVDGWKVVVKAGEFAPGDLCVYFEIDSFLPVKPEYEFLRKACFRSTANLGDGFRIKTIKLRGQISQGLVLPVAEVLMTEAGLINAPEGTDLTEWLGVKKWELPGSTVLRGDAKGSFPSFIPKTDQERAQNLIEKIRARSDEGFEVTMKLDGSSMTIYRDFEGNIGVCSRNIDLKEDDENTFWKTAKKSGVIEWLKTLPFPIALQGELMGPGIQGNRENLPDHKFFLFDIFDIDLGRYYTPPERMEFGGAHGLHRYIEHVPVLHDCFVPGPVNCADPIAALMVIAEGPSYNHNVRREGVVFKSWDSDFTFKVIANSYLLENDA